MKWPGDGSRSGGHPTPRSNNDAVDSAKRAQLKLRWSDGALGGATVSLVSVLCLGQVFSIELTRPLVTALVASCPSLWIVYLVFGSETDASEREGHWRLASLYFCKNSPSAFTFFCESESFLITFTVAFL